MLDGAWSALVQHALFDGRRRSDGLWFDSVHIVILVKIKICKRVIKLHISISFQQIVSQQCRTVSTGRDPLVVAVPVQILFWDRDRGYFHG